VLSFSYELYRNFSDALNSIPSLEVLLCDEGHRLKNVYGTKTSTALANCGAFRRLVLTGTPVQNNLDELYAMVHFAVPWYLGTLREFQVNYADAIVSHQQQSKPSSICEAAERLKTHLQKILIRRTREDILRFILPPRRELVVSISLSSLQQEEYLNETKGIMNTLRDTSISEVKSVLPTLSKLRQICTKSYSGLSEAPSPDTAFESLLARSRKLQLLEVLLLHIKKFHPQDKIVITSNYIENLDECKVITFKFFSPERK
jgi:SNF2 family DNA or RNA helicase